MPSASRTPRSSLFSGLVAPFLALALGAAALEGCTGESTETSAGAGGATDTVSFPEAAFASLPSDSGALSIEVRTAPIQPPERGRTAVELLITDETGAPRDDLSLSVLPWMPDMGHGASSDPSVEPMGNGRYDVYGVAMFMPGRWELRTEITGSVDDSAIIAFQIP